MKYSRDTESFVMDVLGERHALQVTYSTMYFRSRDSMYLGTYLPRITNRWFPSTLGRQKEKPE